MQINFNQKQFATLLKMAYIANWVVNGVRSGAKGDERIKEYADLEKYIFSRAQDFGLEDYVDIESGDIFPSREIEEGEPRDLIDYYDEEVLWEELAHRLASRDFYNDYGRETIENMGVKERIKKNHPYLEKYWEEFDNYGLKRLEVVDKNEE